MDNLKALKAAAMIMEIIEEAKNAKSTEEIIKISLVLMPINDMIYRFGEEILKPMTEKLRNGEDPFDKKEEVSKEKEDLDSLAALGFMFGSTEKN